MCGKIRRERQRAIFYIRKKRTMANFSRVWNSALWKNWISANTTFTDFRRKCHSFYSYFLLIPPAPVNGRIAQTEGGEEFSSVTEIRGGSRMERRSTEKRIGGGLRKNEKTPIWNEGVEESGSFKKTVRYCISPFLQIEPA